MPALPAAHLVHFYSTPEGLAESLCGFFAEPLRRGETVIVVARSEHRRAVDAALRAAGLDLAAETRSGRYLSLDVAETLAGLLADDRPSRELFDRTARATVLEARRRTGSVHVYGELVGTLVAKGDIVGAMELEGMWADLQRESPFPLVCGYPREALEGDLAAVLDGVASIHDAFLAARAATRPRSTADVEIALGPDAARTARRAARAVLTGWGHEDGDWHDDAAVVVSELVGAAARQGSPRVALRIAVEQDHVVVSVLDDDSGRRPPPDEEDLAQAGRSFMVLGALTSGWGVEHTPDGTRTWARLRAASRASPSTSHPAAPGRRIS